MFRHNTVWSILSLGLHLSVTIVFSQTFPDDGLKSQELFKYLSGEVNLDVDLRGQFSKGPDSTRKKLWLFYDEKIVIIGVYSGEFSRPRIDQSGYIYSAPDETRIISARFKADDPGKVVIVQSNKDIVVVDITYDDFRHHYIFHASTRTPNIALPAPTEIIGDALYLLAGAKVFVSRDTGKTWAIDSINIGRTSVSDIALDSDYYAWIATFDGVFYQHPDSNIWHRTSPLPGSFQTSYSIFVDRKERIFVGKPGKIYVSTDRGSNWTDISTGVSGNVTKFSDDAFGNAYATTLGASYRLKNLTPPWEKISDSISSFSFFAPTSNPINAIAGDTIIVASTKFGLFQSSDQGTTWIHVPNSYQLPAHTFYSGVVFDGKYYFISTNLGVFRAALGDSIWEKVFPKQGFISGVNTLVTDSAGNLYSNLPFKVNPATTMFLPVKSADHGSTWIPDTAGLSSSGINAGTQQFDLLVNPGGTQYLKGNGTLVSKKPGGAWKLDTSGLWIKSGEFISDVSLNNKKGFMYLSRTIAGFPTPTFHLYMRAGEDSVWLRVNTDTLAAGDGRMFSDVHGNIIVRTLTSPYKIWRYDGNTWTNIPLPGGATFAQLLTIDKNGVLWGVFFGGFPKGLHFSKDNGVTWKYVGLEKVGMKSLSIIEDTVYAVTIIDGVRAFTTASEPTTVGNSVPQLAASYELHQNYPNPFNPSTTISFKIQVSGFISLKVYDVLGREVATLVNEERKAGTHSVQFDASRLSSGMYIYSLRTGSFSASKKLLLMK